MARTNTDRNASPAAASRSSQRARQTAQDAKPVAAQVKPLANGTKAATGRGLRKAQAWAAPQVERTGQVIQESVAPAARRGLRRARVWAAPQVDRTGQVIQDTVAPKVAAALHASAQRLDPGKPSAIPGARWSASQLCSRRRPRPRPHCATAPHRVRHGAGRRGRARARQHGHRRRRGEPAGPHLLTHSTGDPAACPWTCVTHPRAGRLPCPPGSAAEPTAYGWSRADGAYAEIV